MDKILTAEQKALEKEDVGGICSEFMKLKEDLVRSQEEMLRATEEKVHMETERVRLETENAKNQQRILKVNEDRVRALNSLLEDFKVLTDFIKKELHPVLTRNITIQEHVLSILYQNFKEQGNTEIIKELTLEMSKNFKPSLTKIYTDDVNSNRDVNVAELYKNINMQKKE